MSAHSFPRYAAAIVLAAALALQLAAGQPENSAAAAGVVPSPAPGTAADAIERGRYLVTLGDCVACHTQKGGAPFAGGRPLETPFGTVLSANLTPDPATGIGRYTPDSFYRALHEGIDHEGRHLYPAFPYNYYTRLTRADTDAILAYLRTLAPVPHALERNHLRFPFNIRALMAGWNLLFLHEGPYQPDAAQSAQWNRGAYLVQGAAHCGACHTPKNLAGAPRSGHELQGGRFAALFAPDLTPNTRTGLGAWTREDLLAFLRTGHNTHSAASVEMGEVVAFSTSRMQDTDLQAIASYLATLPASPAPEGVMADAALLRQGEAIYVDACSACHQAGGKGVPGVFPALAGNANLQQARPDTVLQFILLGTRRAATQEAPTPLAMPSFAWKLDDAQVAAVASYVRNAWGNQAAPVDTEAVSQQRARLGLHSEAASSAASAPAVAQTASMQHPGPGTLAPSDTDSRDNGSPRAGRTAAQAPGN